MDVGLFKLKPPMRKRPEITSYNGEEKEIRIPNKGNVKSLLPFRKK